MQTAILVERGSLRGQDRKDGGGSAQEVYGADGIPAGPEVRRHLEKVSAACPERAHTDGQRKHYRHFVFGALYVRRAVYARISVLLHSRSRMQGDHAAMKKLRLTI